MKFPDMKFKWIPGATALIAVAAICATTALSSRAHADANLGSGPDNGTDYVKVVFAQARTALNAQLSGIGPEQLRSYPMDPRSQAWLLGNGADGRPRITALRQYLQVIELRYQPAACEDSQGRKSTICFMYGERRQPVVLVSLDLNRVTTQEQAMVMLIHEAGHFTGEMDHFFLDALGIDLVRALSRPRLLSTEQKSVEIVPNIFAAKAGCEDGSSPQARALFARARQDIAQQCADKRLTCDLSKIESAFQGEPEFLPGRGFTMRVSCTLKAMLRLQ